jgi:hypothetical protein
MVRKFAISGMFRVLCWFAVPLATAALGAGLAWAAGGWRIEPTARSATGHPASLSAVSCPSATRCWAVGAIQASQVKASPVIELWNGHRWTIQALSLPRRLRSGRFSDISCVSARFCMAVGAEAVGVYSPGRSPYGEIWDGRTWTNEPMVGPPVKQGVYAGVTGVSCTPGARRATSPLFTASSKPTPPACVAVGFRLPVGPGGGTVGFAERWNGHNWLTIRSPLLWPNGLSCMSATACMTGGVPTAVGAQLWNGRRWIPQVIPIPRGILAYKRSVPFLTALSCPAARRCVGLAVVRTGLSSTAELTATWNGRKWTSVVIPGASEVSESVGTFGLSGISCRSTSACVAVGSKYPDPIAAYRNGQTWGVETLPKPADEPSASLYQVSCDTVTSCMAVGSSGNEHPTFLRDPLAERYRR